MRAAVFKGGGGASERRAGHLQEVLQPHDFLLQVLQLSASVSQRLQRQQQAVDGVLQAALRQQPPAHLRVDAALVVRLRRRRRRQPLDQLPRQVAAAALVVVVVCGNSESVTICGRLFI